MLQIIPATTEYIDQIQSVFLKYDHIFGFINRTEFKANIRSHNRTNSKRIFIAIDDSLPRWKERKRRKETGFKQTKVLAVAMFRVFKDKIPRNYPEHAVNSVQLMQMVVDSEGQGVGSAMYKFVRDYSYDMPYCKKLWGYASHDNPEIIKFFVEKHNWTLRSEWDGFSKKNNFRMPYYDIVFEDRKDISDDERIFEWEGLV